MSVFAFTAKGHQAIVSGQRQLDTLSSIYPYPRFKKCSSYGEALSWIRTTSPYQYKEIYNYGNTALAGYVKVSYEIDDIDNVVVCTIDKSLVGDVRVRSVDKNLKLSHTDTLIRISWSAPTYSTYYLSNHITVIRRLLAIIGEFVDVNLVVPTTSVYLAITKYRGTNANITSLQKELNSRLGSYSVSIANSSV